jgi:hypothetical protein
LSAPITVKSDLLAGIGAERAARTGRPATTWPFGRVGLIDLFLLDKNRPDSRNSCDLKAIVSTNIKLAVMSADPIL